jgi:phosphate starvation-inducible PhoH-like protein
MRHIVRPQRSITESFQGFDHDSINNKNREETLSESKKQRRSSKKAPIQNNNFTLQKVEPLTRNQKKAFDLWDDGKHLVLLGAAGTGKTYLSLFFALNELLTSGRYKKVVIVRSSVSMRNLGYLPGNKQEKMAEYEAPYVAICSNLFERDDAYDILKRNNTIEFAPTSFMRGLTLDDAIVVVDEVANMVFQELDGLITRIGNNTRLLMCGDYRQSDFRFDDEKEGLGRFMKIVERIPDIGRVDFGIEDCVRSGIVKDYLIAKDAFENVHS